MGPAARPSAGGQGFNLASPRPGGGPPSGRPTSELLGSATFQTPEGESCSQSIDSFVFFLSCGVLERSCPDNLPPPLDMLLLLFRSHGTCAKRLG